MANYMEVHDQFEVIDYDFGAAKTPPATISALIGDFIRNGDTRGKRFKQEGGTYSLLLTKMNRK